MNSNAYMSIPPGTIADLDDTHPAKQTLIRARQNKLRRMKAQDTLNYQSYVLSPLERQLILENERFHRRLMLQREKYDAQRRSLIERHAYGVIGSGVKQTSNALINSLIA